MSFASTPLGQGRRLDQKAFFGQAQPQPRPKPPSRGADNADPLQPHRWAVKDTSVQIANAFIGAVSHSTTTDMAPTSANPTHAWASQQQQQQQQQQRTAVNRSTSVEYESQVHTTNLRRLGGKPPSRTNSSLASGGLAPPPGAAGPRRVVPRTDSLRSVPDSEPEAIGRARSPLADAASALRQGVSSVVSEVGFIMRARSREPEGGPPQDSYDYSAEEREMQAHAPPRRPAPTAATLAPRKSKISADNMAYKPSQSDYEDSEEEGSDGGKRKRRRRKKDAVGGGPLTNLPVAGYDKKRRRRRGKNDPNGPEEEEEDDDSAEQPSTSSVTNLRTTVPPSKSQPPLSRSAAHSAQHFGLDAAAGDVSVPPDASLHADFEEAEPDPAHRLSPPPISRRAVSPASTRLPEADGYRRGASAAPSSPGALAGSVVHALGHVVGALLSGVLHTLAAGVFWAGKVLGALVGAPAHFVGKNQGALAHVVRALMFLGTAYGLYAALGEPLSRLSVGLRPTVPVYTPPGAPPADVGELSARLLSLERSLGDLSTSALQHRNRADREIEKREELQVKLAALERSLRDETKRASEAEERARTAERSSAGELKRELDALRASLASVPRQAAPSGPVSDAEARAKLKALEDKLAGVEGEAKEALELGREAATRAAAKPASGWWTKAGAAPGPLTIRASDGSDVGALIGRLVDGAVARTQADLLARPDFALHSGGAAVIPSLTSETYALRPRGVGGAVLGLVTGHGYAVGRPPVTALHHELHLGHCWPFAGAQGQLGVKLAAPVRVDAVSVDHVAKEVALDMRTAPRDMELWALVEGAESVARVREYLDERARARAAGEPLEDDEDDEAHPAELPRDALYLRLARFAYDAHAVQNVQTFAVPERVRALGVDTGVVALRVRANWGHPDFTCVYRVRVHGERADAPPALVPPPAAEEEAAAARD